MVGARGCAGAVLICSRLKMGVMERRVLVDRWRAWRWTCEQELQVLCSYRLAGGKQMWAEQGRAEQCSAGGERRPTMMAEQQ